MWPLAGIAIVVIGFALRANPLAVVVAAAFGSGLGAGLSVPEVVAALGKAFHQNRYVSVPWLALPVIGLMERAGLQEQAAALISRTKSATTSRILLIYLGFRQITAALGLTQIAGHAQTVRPLLAPMVEAAATRDNPSLSEDERNQVKAMAAATDNVGIFFGEDIFLAIASILLIKGFLESAGIIVQPLELSVWAIPTALAAFAVHGYRLWKMGR
ncbi:DUF969 domain-containing protein [Sandarakinorhabdus sp. AAP62]|uniref:DUF969 domain-containing protein n=1 Tax=Sandarakinorhabdus sp. AAP62 TaxID=1248916 RepID=UPI00047688BE|nr:DUF969 domain-containing protein [Sandarakinorhabdus sp. AAP62]